MYPSRPPVPSGPSQTYKFTVVETCDRIKEEFNYVQNQCHQLQTEREKLLSERVDMQRICVVYYEMANGLNLEMHRQMEISKRLNAILNQVIPFLSNEHQTQVASAIERAKQVTMQELNSVLSAQMEDSKMAKFANGGNMGLSGEQMEIYKQLQAHQLPGGSPSSSLPGGSSNQTGSHTPGGVGSSQGAGAFAGSSGLLPTSTPGLQNTLFNGLMSAAGGAMMPPPGNAGLPLGSNSMRDIKDFSGDEKQRVAAAAAAASQMFRGGVGGQPNLPGPPFLPGGSAALAAAAGFPEGLFGVAAAAAAAAAASGGASGVTTSSSPIGGSLNAPGRSSSAGVARVGSGTSGNPVNPQGSSSLLPPPPPPTPGNSSTPPDEKRRKLMDAKVEPAGRENGGWRSADDMDKSSSSGIVNMNTNRRANNRQPLNLSPQLQNSMSGNYPTTTSAPAVGTPNNRQNFSDGRSKYTGKGNCSGPGVYSYVVLPSSGENGSGSGGSVRPCAMASAPEATSHPSLPNRLQHLASLPHGEVVCAVTIAAAPSGRSYSPASGDGVSPSPAAPEAENVSPSATTRSVAHFAYTGGRGCVKLWDLDAISGGGGRDVTFIASFDCLRSESYVRSIKLFPDSSTLLIGGESNCLTIWDLNGPSKRKGDLSFDAPACYALALSPDCKLCYSCCSDGQVAVWDIHNQTVVQQFHAHNDGASCIELVGHGTRLWTGGLDSKVRCWDIRASSSSSLHTVEFDSQVFSLGLSPIFGSHGLQSIPSADAVFQGTQWLAVGLESSEVEVVAIGPDGPPVSVNSAGGSGNGTSPALKPSVSPSAGGVTSSPQMAAANSVVAGYDQHFRLTRHESCVLALRFAHHADWFVTTGKDHQVNAWKTPYGACLLETKEAASVLTCDISPDDKYVVTGSGDKKANLYEIIYSAGSVNSSVSNVSSSH